LKATHPGTIFDIQRYSIHDGPGIRTTVFLKGCPLRCLWCSNPESQNQHPEIMLDQSLCVRCGTCVEVCPQGAALEQGTGIGLLRERCRGCGKCVAGCPQGARRLVGKQMTVEEIVEEVEKDRLFYKNSGGGITLSGGEPMHQPDFARALLMRCKEKGLHTVLDTSGYAQLKQWDAVLEYVDLVLFDLKQMNPVQHQEYTGVSTELILKSARKIASQKIPMIIRIPLVPGYNDMRGNIEGCARFAQEIHVGRIELLPFHKLCVSKYTKLNKEWKLSSLASPSQELLEEVRTIFSTYSLTCTY